MFDDSLNLDWHGFQSHCEDLDAQLADFTTEDEFRDLFQIATSELKAGRIMD